MLDFLQAEFIGNLNKAKVLGVFVTFDRIKYRNVKVISEVFYKDTKGNERVKPIISDLSGGFIKKTELKELSNKLQIHYTTFRRHFKKLIELGWIKPTHTGYLLIGNRYLFNKYETGALKKLSLRSETKKEVIDEAALLLIKQSLKRQAHKVLPTEKDGKKKPAAVLNSSEFSLSVRYISKKMGFKSATSGSNIEKSLEKKKKLIIQRSNIFCCALSDYSIFLKANPMKENRCFAKDGKVYERRCNNLIPFFKTKEEKSIQKSMHERRVKAWGGLSK